jgi:hypothetical protein
VLEQLAHRRRPPAAAELGEVARRWRVQRDAARRDLLHHHGRDHLLGDRRPGEDHLVGEGRSRSGLADGAAGQPPAAGRQGVHALEAAAGHRLLEARADGDVVAGGLLRRGGGGQRRQQR